MRCKAGWLLILAVALGCADSATPVSDGDAGSDGESGAGRANAEMDAGGRAQGDLGADADATAGGDGAGSAPARVLPDHAAFCQARAELECTRQAVCCEAEGWRVDVALCATEARWSDRACRPDAEPEPGYDPAAASACLQAQAPQRADCTLEPRDVESYLHTQEICDAILPAPTAPGPGEDCNFLDGCVAPAGQISICQPGFDGDSDRCSPAVVRSHRGAPCLEGCLEGLVCGADDVCVDAPPLLPDGAECSSGRCASGHCGDDGRCAPPPVADEEVCARHDEVARHTLYVEPNNSAQIVINKAEVLWRRNVAVIPDDVRRAPKDGSGSVRGLDVEGSQLPNDGRLLATDDALYFLVHSSIVRVSLDDGTRRELAGPGFAAAAMIRRERELIVAAGACAQVARVALSDGGAEVHPTQLRIDSPALVGNVHIAADDDAIFCAHGAHLARFPRGADGEVLRSQIFDSEDDLLLTGLASLDDSLYVQTVRGFPFDPQYALTRYHLPTGTVTAVAAPGPVGKRVLADAERGHLYWHTGSGIQVYEPAQDRFELLELEFTSGINVGFAADQTHLYWTTGGSVLRVAKP
ncbi:MAG: hypothetical protein PVI30_12385 [Myxococcales bacterium]